MRASSLPIFLRKFVFVTIQALEFSVENVDSMSSLNGPEKMVENHKNESQNSSEERTTPEKMSLRALYTRERETTRDKICKVVKENGKNMEETLNQIDCFHLKKRRQLVNMVLSEINSPEAALRFFRWTKGHPWSRYKPNTAIYDQLVKIVVDCGNFDNLKELLSDRIADRCFNSIKTFAFATALPHDGQLLQDLTKTINSLEGFAKQNAYDMLIASFCRKGFVEKALFVMEEMQASGRADAPTSYTFRPFLLIYSHNNQLGKIHELFERMKDAGCPPDSTSYNIVLRKLNGKGEYLKAQQLFKTMVNCKPDKVTYHIIIQGALWARKLRFALHHFGRMKEEGLKPMHCTYKHLIWGFMWVRAFEKAYEFVKQESGNDRSLDLSNYSCLVWSYCRHSKFQKAFDVVMDMQSKGLNPNRKLTSRWCCYNAQGQVAGLRAGEVRAGMFGMT